MPPGPALLFGGGGWLFSIGLLFVGAYAVVGPGTHPDTALWVATGLAFAVGVAMVWRGEQSPRWAPLATLAVIAGLYGTERDVGSVLFLALLLLSICLMRLRYRPAVLTAVAGLALGLLAALRARLVGELDPTISIVLAYALTFTAIVALRQRRGHQWETERLLADLAEEHRQLEVAHRRLAEQARHAAELAASEERNRIAREIHDVLAHALTVMIVQAEAAAVRLRADPAGAADQVRRVADLARSALAEARLSVSAMRADPSTTGVSALQRLCEDTSRLGDMTCALRVEGAEQALTAPVALAAYRILQEAITNARRHGGAGQVDAVLAFAPGRVTLTVTDDGAGPGLRDPVPGSGLRGMQERAGALGGDFRAGPRVGAQGFEVRAELPLGAADVAEEVRP